MDLSKTNLSIATLLRLMETQEPEAIQVNHVVITDSTWGLPISGTLEQLPSFTVQFAGYVEVEMYMDPNHQRVVRICVRQTAMTFSELEENGEVLPALTINCQVLEAGDRGRLDAIAARYVKEGKMNDQTRGEALLTQYAAKAMFCPRKYGGMSHA